MSSLLKVPCTHIQISAMWKYDNFQIILFHMIIMRLLYNSRCLWQTCCWEYNNILLPIWFIISNKCISYSNSVALIELFTFILFHIKGAFRYCLFFESQLKDRIDTVNITKLRINKTVDEDAAEYSCEVYHHGTSSSTFFKVFVFNQTTIDAALKDPGTTMPTVFESTATVSSKLNYIFLHL